MKELNDKIKIFKETYYMSLFYIFTVFLDIYK